MRTLHAALAFGCLFVVAAGVAGCSNDDPRAPPVVYFGDDVCDVCHMIVSDERFAAALCLVDERGRVSKPVFDDIGCLFEYEAANPSRTVLARHVRHGVSGQWLDTDAAIFVHSAQIHSPMAFGMAALADRAEAEALRAERGGDVIDFSEATRRALSGQGVRSGAPSPGEAGAIPGGMATDDAGLIATIALADGRELRLTLRSPKTLAPGMNPFEFDAHLRAPRGDWLAADALRFEIRPFMPTMNHGSPRNEHPTHVGGGRYRGVTNLIMAGPWEVRVTVFEDDREIARHAFNLEAKR